jgi:hypothetical protein
LYRDLIEGAADIAIECNDAVVAVGGIREGAVICTPDLDGPTASMA